MEKSLQVTKFQILQYIENLATWMINSILPCRNQTDTELNLYLHRLLFAINTAGGSAISIYRNCFCHL